MTLDNPPEECWEWAKDNARPVAIPATRTPTANSVLTTSSPMRPYGTSGVGGRRFPVPHRPTDQHNRAESPKARSGGETRPSNGLATLGQRRLSPRCCSVIHNSDQNGLVQNFLRWKTSWSDIG